MKIFSFLRNNDDGASAVEFAIVLPLFLIFVFGIIEFGIIMYNKALITNASREGARFGILYTGSQDAIGVLSPKIAKRVKLWLGIDPETDDLSNSRLISLGGSALPDISSTLSIDDPDTDDDYITVKVTYDYDFLLLPELKFGEGLSNPLPIGATTTMRMENQEYE